MMSISYLITASVILFLTFVSVSYYFVVKAYVGILNICISYIITLAILQESIKGFVLDDFSSFLKLSLLSYFLFMLLGLILALFKGWLDEQS